MEKQTNKKKGIAIFAARTPEKGNSSGSGTIEIVMLRQKTTFR